MNRGNSCFKDAKDIQRSDLEILPPSTKDGYYDNGHLIFSDFSALPKIIIALIPIGLQYLAVGCLPQKDKKRKYLIELNVS